MLLETIATTLGGAVTGMFVGDAMKAVPQKTAMPATSHSASTKTTGDGAIVTSGQTPRQALWLSGAIVVGAMVTLIGGSKLLKDARIG